MNSFLPIVCFLCLSGNVLGQIIQQEWIDDDDEISYQDLLNANLSCFPRDSCSQDRADDYITPISIYTCSCDTRCWELGTCCIDSPHRFKTPKQKCRKIANKGFYMVPTCPDNTKADSIWKIQCEREWNGEDDILMLSPVTSLETSLTYKNYYCFRCHEITDKYFSWNLIMENSNESPQEPRNYSVAYNQEQKTWMATVEENHISIPVNLSFELPYHEKVQSISCDPYIVSSCPDTWTDKLVRDRCLAYTALVTEVFYSTFKNPHCALCNGIPFDRLECFVAVGGYGFKGIFNFRHLLDINSSDEDKVGNDEKCDSDHLWDPYSKKCRKKSCAVPGYVIQNDRCVRL